MEFHLKLQLFTNFMRVWIISCSVTPILLKTFLTTMPVIQHDRLHFKCMSFSIKVILASLT